MWTGDQSTQLSTWARPHFLEFLTTNCITLAEDCTGPRTKRILRLLAADLALEAERYHGIIGRNDGPRRSRARMQLPKNDSSPRLFGSY
jgi:hypothetical protein